MVYQGTEYRRIVENHWMGTCSVETIQDGGAIEVLRRLQSIKFKSPRRYKWRYAVSQMWTQ